MPGATRSRAEIEADVRRLGWWYQCFELPGGVMTSPGRPPAYFPETRWKLVEPFVPPDLTGKTVLDVGGNAGYFSVQMMRRGAKSCTLIEPYEEFAAQARYVADLFAYDIEVIAEDVHTWCLTHDARFDYVIFLGLFYHLKYPGIVLDRLAEMTRELMLFQSHIADEENPAIGSGHASALDGDSSFPRLAFIENLYKGDPTNWWLPDAAALDALVRSAGMNVIARPHPHLLVARPGDVPGKVVYEKLVFPKYRKPGGAMHPGSQRVEPELWERLIRERDENQSK